MAKPAKTQANNNKALSAITLVVLLIVTVAFLLLGVTGRKLDSEGLYKLLPWIPTPTSRFEWREALVPGADFGETETYTYTSLAKDTAEFDATVSILSARVAQMGSTGVALDEQDGNKLLLTLPKGVYTPETISQLSSVGHYAFADGEGNDFLDGSHITNANIAPADQTMQNWYLSFELDEEGKKIFGDKTTELVGQNVLLKKDGITLMQANIGEPLTEGGASLPGFTYEDAFVNALLMRSGALPADLGEAEAQVGAPMLGEATAKNALIGLWATAAVICVGLILKYRLAGIIAAWALVAELGLLWFFAALMKVGFTVSSLLAITVTFALAVYGVLVVYQGMAGDLARGRAAKQALKESYSTFGHVALDVFVPLFILSLVLIIMDSGVIGQFFRMLAVGMLVNMAAVFIILRVLLSNTISVVGEKSTLYISGRAKEAV